MDTIKKTSLILITGWMLSGHPHAASSTMFVQPAFECTLTNKLDVYNWPGKIQDVFATMAPKIYFICMSDNAVTGDVLKAVWIADHTIGGFPPNHVMAVKKLVVYKPAERNQTTEANFSMSKPPQGWPAGSYHIQLYINGIESYTYPFIVR